MLPYQPNSLMLQYIANLFVPTNCQKFRQLQRNLYLPQNYKQVEFYYLKMEHHKFLHYYLVLEFLHHQPYCLLVHFLHHLQNLQDAVFCGDDS